jgi:hypothetical protein
MTADSGTAQLVERQRQIILSLMEINAAERKQMWQQGYDFGHHDGYEAGYEAAERYQAWWWKVKMRGVATGTRQQIKSAVDEGRTLPEVIEIAEREIPTEPICLTPADALRAGVPPEQIVAEWGEDLKLWPLIAAAVHRLLIGKTPNVAAPDSWLERRTAA